MRDCGSCIGRKDNIAAVAPDAAGEYTVEVTGYGHVSVVKVRGISPAHAVFRAFESRGIRARVLSHPETEEEEEEV